MGLPDFLWLWRIAAWSMGFSLAVYTLLAVSGLWIRRQRLIRSTTNLRPLHMLLGSTLVVLVLLLFAIGIVGTLGHFGSLGHSLHLSAGLGVVCLVLLSAWSATRISAKRPWARPLHLACNGLLLIGLTVVLATGWQVVQKYLPR